MDNINVLISEARIQKRIDELAKQIMKDYGEEDLVFVGVLKGASIFMIELALKIKNNVEFEFIQARSYEGIKSTGKVEITQDFTRKNRGEKRNNHRRHNRYRKNIRIFNEIYDFL